MTTRTRLKRALHEVDERAGDLWLDLPLLSVSISWGVRRREEVSADESRAADLSNYKIAKEGSLVINRMRAFQGALGVARETGVVSPDYAVLEVANGIDRRWLSYLMTSSSFVSAMASVVRGIGGTDSGNVRTPRLNVRDLGDLEVSLPSTDEQRAIADYLDREAAQIDALIAKQEQLIASLRERRQATIDGAIEAAQPQGRMQLRRAIEFLTSGSRGWGEYYADAGARFVRIGNLPRTSLELRGEVQHIKLPEGVTEGSRTRLEAEDLLFSITAYLGSVAVVDGDWVNAYVSQHVALCRLDRTTLDPRFAGYFMLTTDGQHQLKEGAFGGTKLQLALGDIRSLVVPVLPLTEQRRIATVLDEQTAKIDALIAKTERFIELSKERRTALITAAVTGQIDVRASA